MGRKVGMTSSQYGPYAQGCTRATMPGTWEAKSRDEANPQSRAQFGLSLQLDLRSRNR